MSLPLQGGLELEPGILWEQTLAPGRLLLWLPVPSLGQARLWERVGSVPGPHVSLEQGFCTIPATLIPARQCSAGWLAKLLGWLGRRPQGQTWLLPNGQSAEQTGERQSDLLLAWAAEGAAPLDEARLKARWPQCRRIQRLGQNLFLVGGVAEASSTTDLGPAQPPKACKHAQDLLAAARKAGDRAAEASALIDLGAVTYHGGNAVAALPMLHQALTLARQLGDRAREVDALINLGQAQKSAGQPEPAGQSLDQALSLALEASDRFAEKLALEQLGSVQAGQGDHAGAIARYEQALALAQAVGHRQHQADLLWLLAIQHADLDQRPQAVRHGEAALTLLQELDHPQRKLFADHLEQYRSSEAAFSWGAAPGSGGGTATAAAVGPGLLRMAWSLAKAMVKYVGSGLKTVAPAVQQQRLKSCGSCAHHTGVRCRLCGCFTSVKTRLPHETCPLGKWAR